MYNKKRALIFAGIFLLVLAVYIIDLGNSPLLDPDEPIYGQFVKEMVRSGDWLTPRYNGELWFDKPPVFYWCAAICVKLFGLTEFALRLPSAIFGALTVLVVFFLACHDYGRRAGALAAAVFGTTLLQIVLVHAEATDSAMVFFMTAGLYCYRRWLDSSRHALWWILCCGICAGMGLITKGPSVPLLMLATMVLHLLWTRQMHRLNAINIATGVLAALAVGMPWYIAMYGMHGQVFVDQFLVANNFTRFVQPLHSGQSKHWYSYSKTLGLFVLFFFPWNVYMLQSVFSSGKQNIGARLMMCWMFCVLLLFSASSTQNFTYSFPAFPACAVLVGGYLSRLSLDKSGKRHNLLALTAGLVLSSLVAVALHIIADRKYPHIAGAATGAGLVLVVAFALPIWLILLNKIKHMNAAYIVAGGMAIFNLVLICRLAPMSAEYDSSKEVAQAINAGQKASVASFRLWRPGLMYYLDIQPKKITEEQELDTFQRSDKPELIVCNIKDEEIVRKHLPGYLLEGGGLCLFANPAYLHSARHPESGRFHQQ